MIAFYNKYYIRTDDSGNITEGWSNGPQSTRAPTEADILLNDRGSYQFRLFPGGEENPILYTMENIPLYKWTGSEVVQRTEEEIAADLAQKKLNRKQEKAERKAKDPTTIMMNMIAEIEDALCELSKEEA